MAIKGFLGKYDINIDDKGRVRIPAKFKAQLGEEFVISCGNRECLSVYPESEWEKMTQQLEKFDGFNEEVEDFKRTIYANATEAEYDSVGRVLIPIRYREYASLTKELVVSGVGDHFEIWDAAKWNGNSYSSVEKRRTLQKEVSLNSTGGKNGI